MDDLESVDQQLVPGARHMQPGERHLLQNAGRDDDQALSCGNAFDRSKQQPIERRLPRFHFSSRRSRAYRLLEVSRGRFNRRARRQRVRRHGVLRHHPRIAVRLPEPILQQHRVGIEHLALDPRGARRLRSGHRGGRRILASQARFGNRISIRQLIELLFERCDESRILRGLRRVEGLRFGVDAALQRAQLVERGRRSVRARTGSALHQQLQQTARPAALADLEGLCRMATTGIGRMLRHEHADE